jgi:hypothetical protein
MRTRVTNGTEARNPILRLERAQAALDELAAKRRADEALEEFKKEAQRLLREQAAAHRCTTNKSRVRIVLTALASSATTAPAPGAVIHARLRSWSGAGWVSLNA